MLRSRRTEEELKEVELPTFIDMVFLLLVFFIVNLSVSTSIAIPVPPQEIELPRASGNAATMEGGRLSTLTFQIQREQSTEGSTRKMVYVLYPGTENLTESDALADIKARLSSSPPDCSRCAVFNSNFLALRGAQLDNLRAFQLIRESIQDYRDRELMNTDISNSIEIIADAETEFKIINYIFQHCQDDTVAGIPRSVPKITFRVMPARPVE